ncbi:MAG: DUF4131 domain-containing protein, partial [Clostridia bacterium]|nr:DUF4131 domain-containing protein [Clostridia bacterium]
MKRPLACFGFTMFCVLLCLSFCESTAVSVSLAVVCTVAFIISLIIRKSRQHLILPVVLCAAVSGCLLFSFFQNYYNKAVTAIGDDISVVGRVTERPAFSRENKRYYFVIKTESVNGEKISTKMRVSFSEAYDEINSADINIGDEISFKATVYKAGSSSAYSRRSYKSDGIYLGAYSVKMDGHTEPEYRPFGYYIDILRE